MSFLVASWRAASTAPVVAAATGADASAAAAVPAAAAAADARLYSQFDD